MNTFELEVRGKKVLIFGLGRQGGGVGDYEWLERHGAIVRASDKDKSLAPEGQTKEQIDWAEIIIKNPGVPDDNELIIYAKSHGLPVLTSVAIFVKYAGVKTIGVTGTRGKSTTVALITTMLEKAFPGQVFSGGNIAGTSCLSLFDQLEGRSFAVLELSSFQLHNFHDLKVSPNIALITNLYPDHLNRYTSMADYQHDKTAIVMYQRPTDITLFNRENPGATAIALKSTGQTHNYFPDMVKGWKTQLPGLHNRENLAAMLAVGQILKIPESICKIVAQDFRGVPFRQEKIRTVAGVTYINDTTATTPTAAIKALQAATTPTIWITGGDTKKLPFVELINEIKGNQLLKNIVILGSKNIPNYISQLRAVAGPKIIGTTSTMAEAIALCRDVAKPGDAVLLSPGFASFDLFQNEFDRGRQFNDVVNSL